MMQGCCHGEQCSKASTVIGRTGAKDVNPVFAWCAIGVWRKDGIEMRGKQNAWTLGIYAIIGMKFGESVSDFIDMSVPQPKLFELAEEPVSSRPFAEWGGRDGEKLQLPAANLWLVQMQPSECPM
jgi:hypothetical protein